MDYRVMLRLDRSDPAAPRARSQLRGRLAVHARLAMTSDLHLESGTPRPARTLRVGTELAITPRSQLALSYQHVAGAAFPNARRLEGRLTRVLSL